MKKIYTLLTIALVCAVTAQTSFSKPAVIQHPTSSDEGRDKTLSISPNRTTGDIAINFKASLAEEVSITVLDADGKAVLKQRSSLIAGNNKINIDHFGSLSEGQYIIRLYANHTIHSTSFLLWK